MFRGTVRNLIHLVKKIGSLATAMWLKWRMCGQAWMSSDRMSQPCESFLVLACSWLRCCTECRAVSTPWAGWWASSCRTPAPSRPPSGVPSCAPSPRRTWDRGPGASRRCSVGARSRYLKQVSSPSPCSQVCLFEVSIRVIRGVGLYGPFSILFHMYVISIIYGFRLTSSDPYTRYICPRK